MPKPAAGKPGLPFYAQANSAIYFGNGAAGCVVDTTTATLKGGGTFIRLTGGEPTIRPDLTSLVRMLKAIPEIEDIALSTNGVRL